MRFNTLATCHLWLFKFFKIVKVLFLSQLYALATFQVPYMFNNYYIGLGRYRTVPLSQEIMLDKAVLDG